MKKLPNQKPRLAYGWAPDLPDNRDHQYAAPMAKLRALPAKADLRNLCPPVYNQGQIGSCTANAIAAALEFGRKKQKLADFIPSRLFIYYNERNPPCCASSIRIRCSSTRSSSSSSSAWKTPPPRDSAVWCRFCPGE